MKQAAYFISRRVVIAILTVTALVIVAAHIQGQEGTVAPVAPVTVQPDLFVEGEGENIDSPEIWKQSGTNKLYMFVSGKANELVEKWNMSSAEPQELDPLELDSRPNGLAIDDENGFLMIGDSEKMRVSVYALPKVSFVKHLGAGLIKSGETNVDILRSSDSKNIILVSDDNRVHGFDLATEKQLFSIVPPVDGIEEVLADNYHKIIYIPEESGGKSKKHPNGAILAYDEKGAPLLRNGTNAFGKGVFSGDEEGIALYRCQVAGKDTGRGFIIVANQSHENNSFEFFDRQSWQHLASVNLEGVTNTDGIESYDQPLPNYPQGLFAAVNNDKDVALISWEKILTAANMSCQ